MDNVNVQLSRQIFSAAFVAFCTHSHEVWLLLVFLHADDVCRDGDFGVMLEIIRNFQH
jgi:hypothetical protein